MSDLSLLYIDDESENLVLLKYLFTDEFLIRTASSYEEALKMLETYDDIRIILCDQRMPGKKGVEILEEFFEQYPDKLRILITAYSDIQVIADAVNRARIYHYIPKPIDENNFKMVIANAMTLINEKKKQELLSRELKTSLDLYRSITENSHDMIFRFDTRFRFLYVNSIAQKFIQSKQDDITGFTPAEAGLPEEWCRYIQEKINTVIQSSVVHRCELRFNQFDWDLIIIPEKDYSGNITSILCSARDVTDLKRYESEKQMKEKMILRAQRLTSLGTLSSAIAHEIKQPLQLIKVIADTIKLRLKKQDKLSELDQKNLNDLSELSSGINRINEIINNMKKIINSNKNDLSIDKTDITELIHEILEIYGQKFKNHSIILKEDLYTETVMINCSGILIQQMIANLINNAIEALDETDRNDKKLLIHTEVRGGCFFIHVGDNGTGIQAAVRETLFDPMVTTKVRGDSMGMGLYIVQTILKSINGDVTINSQDEFITVFSIRIPLEKL